MRGLAHVVIVAVAVAAGLMLDCVAAGAGVPGSAPSARAAAESAIAEILAGLRDPALGAAGRAQRVKAAAGAHMDFDALARLSLGPATWRDLTEAQRAAFTKELREHMLHLAGRSVSKYDGESVTVTGDRAEANGDWTVSARIARKPDPRRPEAPPEHVANLDFRLRRRPGDGGAWKVIDVHVQGLSLAVTFRAQFTAILRTRGFEQVLQALREKNAASAKAEAEAEAEATGTDRK